MSDTRAIATDANGDERYVVISADCHGGGDILDYRPYLESAGTTSSTPGRRRTSRRTRT